MLSTMAPDDPLHREYPPLPEKPPPFDLDALGRIERPSVRRFRWRRGRGLPQLEEAAPKVTTARSSVALLALIPGSEQCAAIRDALGHAGAPYAVPPRLTLRNGLSMQDERAWRVAVEQVTSAWRPFTVRLRPPELLDDRMVCLAPVGDAVSDLQHALGSALSTAGFVPRSGDVASPVVLLGGTFTGLNRQQLHELVNAVADSVDFPMDFRASAVYAVAEAADDADLPIDAFPLAG
ncbi:MAG TPA: hypothetical protein VEP49_20260 [Acidimicrobiia bacterium]|nr:hypothetical protein [Acidimicrobiia bacterium]